MTFDFTGQTVIVTGAAHGFGRVIALAFASRGAHVWACDILAHELQVTERMCAGMRGSCTSRVVDVRSKNDVESFVSEVTGAGPSASATSVLSASSASKILKSADSAESASGADAASAPNSVTSVSSVVKKQLTTEVTEDTEMGNAAASGASSHVDILVNNAGGVLGQVGRPLEAISPADWQSIFDVNVTGAFYLSQAVAPGMKRARRGRIVNISSGAGLGISLTGIQAYASAKAAQIGLTRQLAHELGPFGITVNNIAPGFVRSNPTTERQWESYGAEGQAALIDRIALKRLGTPDDIAHGVLFFASDYASWITGQVLSIDGGK